MPKAGLEPACLAAPPPQDGVSANSTTSARRNETAYLPPVVGAAGAGAGVAGVAGAAAGAAGLAPDSGQTDPEPAGPAMIVSASEVTMKIIAAAVVAFESNVAEPR